MRAVAGDMGMAREPSEAAAAAAIEGSGGHPGGGGSSSSNARSFRFLLTLALRKAQTAVTLDNGGHVDEAIRTYREAISMLGLVLDRTSEEDGRQRLLHFTYSDRVSVLSSLQPTTLAAPLLSADSDDPLPRLDPPRPIASDAGRQSPQQTPAATASDGENRAGSPWARAMMIPGASPTGRTPVSTAAGAASTDSGDRAFQRSEASPRPAPARGPGSGRLLAPATLTVDLAQRLALGSPGETLTSPIDTHKPLPPIQAAVRSPTAQRKLSTASSGTGGTGDLAASAAGPGADDASGTPPPATDGESAPPAQSDRDEHSEAAAGTGEPNDSVAPRKGRKDTDKAGRRQSVKNQRSLPAMFGIGAKPRSDSRPAPPVPPLNVPENNTANFGRRLLGALRSTPTTGDPQAGRPSLSRSNSEDVSAPEPPRANNIEQVAGPGPVEAMAGDRSRGAVAAFGVDDEPPPPTPSKESPPLPEKIYGKTLTREQKRQSNAAHRLAGLFKRKPSIPEIPASALPSKFPADAGQSGAAFPQSPQSLLSKDHRLSASASTPNLFEAAAAAASSDQPAIAVFQATERGMFPPMPAPPTIRPGMPAADPAPGAVDDVMDATADREPNAEAGPRAERDTAANGTPNGASSSAPNGASSSAPNGTSNIAPNGAAYSAPPAREHARRPSQQLLLQPPIGRPSLRIATKSALDVLTFVPEDAPLPIVPMTAAVDGAARSRKSSINTSASQSQSQPRTSGVAAPSITATATASTGGGGGGGSQSLEAPGHPIYGRATLTDVEEDQRLEMFEPAYGTFHPDLGPPPAKGSPLAALWFTSTLHRSMVSGGAHLTANLYVPRRMWFQSGIRIAAIDAKLGVLGQLTQAFASVGAHLTLPDIDALVATASVPHDERRAETAPWESEDAHSPADRDKDDLHRSCVALHHWLSSLEESLDSSRRLLSKRLKFVGASGSGQPPQAPTAHAGGPGDNLYGSVLNMNVSPFYGGDGVAGSIVNGNGGGLANGSLQNLVLGHGDLAPGNGAPATPLSPGGDPMEARLSEALNGAASMAPSVNKDALTKDQLGNSRFKGLGKLGKSVDRIYSTMQKEKLDDTSAYVAALQRLFEAAMVLEDLMHYFARIAGDDELAGWFAEAPQSPAPLAARRGLERSQADAGPSSPAAPAPRTALVSEPSMSSMNSGSERKSSNASASAANAAAEKKIRRRSNYFSQRQLSTGLPDGVEPLGAPVVRAGTKPRGDSLSVIPRVVPVVLAPATAAPASGPVQRFVLAPSPIKNPASYVRQGRGRAPGVIYARLSKITEWLSQVLVAWVVRDLQVLYAKYIKRLREWSAE